MHARHLQAGKGQGSLQGEFDHLLGTSNGEVPDPARAEGFGFDQNFGSLGEMAFGHAIVGHIVNSSLGT